MSTLCDTMDCSLPGSSVHGIFQSRILGWVVISFSRRSSQHRGWTRVSHIVGRCFTVWATRGSRHCNSAHFPLIFSASSTCSGSCQLLPSLNSACKIVTSTLFLSVSRDKLSDHFYAKNCPASHLMRQIQEHRARPSWILVLCFCSWNWWFHFKTC